MAKNALCAKPAASAPITASGEAFQISPSATAAARLDTGSLGRKQDQWHRCQRKQGRYNESRTAVFSACPDADE